MNVHLSPRELQTLTLMCRGLGQAQIARQLSVMPDTINKYRASLRIKTDCTSSVQLGVWAVRNGIVQ